MTAVRIHADPVRATVVHATLTLICGLLMLFHAVFVLPLILEVWLFRRSYLRVGRETGVIDS